MARSASSRARPAAAVSRNRSEMQGRGPGRKAASAGICLLLVAVACVPPFFVSNAIGYIGVLFIICFLGLCVLVLQASSHALVLNPPELAGTFRRLACERMTIPLFNRLPLPISRIDVFVRVPSDQGGMRTERFTKVPLRGRSMEELASTVRFPHLGTYSIGVERITVFDPSGLFWRTLPVDFSLQVEVLPRIVPLENADFSQRIYRESLGVQSAMTLDSMDYSGSREFVLGDPLKLINWKLSARGEVIYSKVLETYGRPSLSIVVDRSLPNLEGRDALDVFDALVEAACSLACSARSRGMEVSVFQHDAAMNATAIDFRDERDLAPFLPSPQKDGRHESVGELMALACSNLHASGNVIVCASRVEPETVERLSALKRQGRSPFLILVTPRGRAAESVFGISEALELLRASNVGYRLCSSVEGLVERA